MCACVCRKGTQQIEESDEREQITQRVEREKEKRKEKITRERKSSGVVVVV